MSKIYIVDDHPVSQLAVRVVAENNGYEVAGVSDNGRDAINALRENAEVALVVIDIEIPPPNGLEVIKRLRQHGFSGGILVLTGYNDSHFVDRARRAGANGFISKNNHLDQLVDAIKAILSGYEFFPQRPQTGNTSASVQSESELLGTLSNRELEVLGLISRGEMLIDIAAQLHVSNKSISTYKRRIMAKLGFSKTLEMIEFAKRNNLA
ncbi:hypothetical protein VW41_09805 [Klebsiella michiganensis]|nr:hypothetical protein VW41_09805 [Klebsiella michiganensis]